ncbi:MAG: helix-turn-helix domain-containing protein, partial [Aquificae bacterium]|nr:helix-turn-helix domain-containing protein [Aquificota bacterium]
RKVLAQAGYIEDLREKMKTRALELKQAGLSTRQIAKVLEEEFGEKVSHMTIHNWLKSVKSDTRVLNFTPNNTPPQGVANNTRVSNAPPHNPSPQKEEEFKQLDPKKELLEFILADAELYKYDPLPHLERKGLLDLLKEEHWERVNQIRGCYSMINLLLV